MLPPAAKPEAAWQTERSGVRRKKKFAVVQGAGCRLASCGGASSALHGDMLYFCRDFERGFFLPT